MPNIHAYLPDHLYQAWKSTFEELKIDPSRWVQDSFNDLLSKKQDTIALQRTLLEKKQQFEQLKLEIDNIESLLKDLQVAESKRRELQIKENEVLSTLDPVWIIKMTNGLIEEYGLKDQNVARQYAIDYLLLREIKKITLQEYMKEKLKIEVKNEN
jgi:hypothetical protein